MKQKPTLIIHLTLCDIVQPFGAQTLVIHTLWASVNCTIMNAFNFTINLKPLHPGQ